MLWIYEVILLPFSIAFPYFTFWHLETQAKYFAWDRLVVGLSLVFVDCSYFIWKLFCKFIEHSHLLVCLVERVCKICRLSRILESWFQIWKSIFQAISSFYNFMFLFSATYLSVFSFLLSKICNLIFTFMFRFFILKFLNIIFS